MMEMWQSLHKCGSPGIKNLSLGFIVEFLTDVSGVMGHGGGSGASKDKVI